MPGFNMGSNINGNTYPSRIEPKFKHRWTFSFDGMNTELLLEKCRRPSVKWNEKSLRYGHETVYFSTDVVWEPLNITIYDTESINAALELIKFRHSSSDIQSENTLITNHKIFTHGYKDIAHVKMLNAKGNPIEEWTLYGAWIQSINFGELSYIASDIQKIDIVVRFDRAEYYG